MGGNTGCVRGPSLPYTDLSYKRCRALGVRGDIYAYLRHAMSSRGAGEEKGSSRRGCKLDIRCDLTCAAVGRVAWQYLKTHLSLKHSQKQLATGANSWFADHRKQLAATNVASSAEMTLSKGMCHLQQLYEVHRGSEQEEGCCWTYAQSSVQC